MCFLQIAHQVVYNNSQAEMGLTFLIEPHSFETEMQPHRLAHFPAKKKKEKKKSLNSIMVWQERVENITRTLGCKVLFNCIYNRGNG